MVPFGRYSRERNSIEIQDHKSLYSACQRRSHLISIGASKLSFEGPNRVGGGRFRKIVKKQKMVRFRAFQGVFFLNEFSIFFFLDILSVFYPDVICATSRTNRKYSCGECRTCCTPIYAHAC